MAETISNNQEHETDSERAERFKVILENNFDKETLSILKEVIVDSSPTKHMNDKRSKDDLNTSAKKINGYIAPRDALESMNL